MDRREEFYMRLRFAKGTQYTVLWLLLLLTLFPFYMLLISSLKYRNQILHHFWTPTLPLHFDNYASAYEQIAPFILNSVIVTVGIMVLVILVSGLAAYSFARFEYPGKTFLYMAILSLLMVPGFLLLIPQFLLVKQMGLLNTYLGQILPTAAYISALATMLMRTFFEGLPNSLYEAAELEGAGDFKVLTHIVIPLSKPIIASVAIISALIGWNNYIWPLVITTGEKVKPVILALNSILSTADQGNSVQLAGFVIASIPLLILFAFSTKPFISGLTSGAVKG